MEQYSILVVDDQLENLETMINFLKGSKSNYKIMKAPNGKIACEIAEKKKPDLIITDWDMPVMNGIEAIKWLKNNNKTKDIPIIVASGAMTLAENVKTALEVGAVDYIKKPVDKIELSARVNSMLKLSESYKEISLLNATKDKFFSIIAHDLKSPFTGLLGLTEILNNDYDSISEVEKKDYLKLLHNNSKKTFNLLQNLLEWSTSQRGKIVYKPENIVIKQLILENISLLENNAKEKNIKFDINNDNELSVFADKNMILTVLRNLISNAIKFTAKNGIVTVGCKQKDEKNIRVFVTDTGIGIAKENIPKLFSIERDVKTEGTEKETGTGLGLILCKEFIEQHGSEIKVKSEIGKSSTFYFNMHVVE